MAEVKDLKRILAEEEVLVKIRFVFVFAFGLVHHVFRWLFSRFVVTYFSIGSVAT